MNWARPGPVVGVSNTGGADNRPRGHFSLGAIT